MFELLATYCICNWNETSPSACQEMIQYSLKNRSLQQKWKNLILWKYFSCSLAYSHESIDSTSIWSTETTWTHNSAATWSKQMHDQRILHIETHWESTWWCPCADLTYSDLLIHCWETTTTIATEYIIAWEHTVSQLYNVWIDVPVYFWFFSITWLLSALIFWQRMIQTIRDMTSASHV